MNDSNYNLVVVRDSAILTTSYVDATVLSSSIVNPQYNKQIAFFLDFTIGSLTSLEARVYGSVDGTNYVLLHTVPEYSFTASGTYIVSVPAVTPYVKLQVKGTGTVTSSLCKATAICSDTPFPLGQLASFNSIGQLITAFGERLDSINDEITVFPKCNSVTLTADGSVKASPGIVVGLLINSCTTGGTFTLYDNTAESGTPIAAPVLATRAAGAQMPQYIPIPGRYAATAIYGGFDGTLAGSITVYYY